MKKFNLLILLFFFGSQIIAQTSGTVSIPRIEITKFFVFIKQQAIKKQNFRLYNLPSWTPTRKLLERISLVDSIFNESDINFILQQVSQSKCLIWDETFIEGATFLNQSDILNKNMEHYSLSVPYFSSDLQACIISVGHYCGRLCATESVKIYKKVDNAWTFYRTIFTTKS